MMAIIAGSLILSWVSVVAGRALLALTGSQPAWLTELALPALVWLGWLIWLALRVPGSTLLAPGEAATTTLVGSLLAVTLVCAVLPVRFWRVQKAR